MMKLSNYLSKHEMPEGGGPESATLLPVPGINDVL
jgi:hypothetical protein